MTWTSELRSWFTWSQPASFTSTTIKPSDVAPSTEKLRLPHEDGKPVIVIFLRHCGCPFAEKTFRLLRSFAAAHPDTHCVAVSQSDEPHTQQWLRDVGGEKDSPSSPAGVRVIVDSDRDLYGRWGLGTSGWLHVLDPRVMMQTSTLEKEDGIAIRGTQSGNRWQTGGHFGVDAKGVVRWGRVDVQANDIPDFEEGLKAIEAAGA